METTIENVRTKFGDFPDYNFRYKTNIYIFNIVQVTNILVICFWFCYTPTNFAALKLETGAKKWHSRLCILKLYL